MAGLSSAPHNINAGGVSFVTFAIISAFSPPGYINASNAGLSLCLSISSAPANAPSA
jgi:hypothetical protein